MEISAILFDLDGVFCSTDRFHYRAWKELADRLGLPFNEEINRQLRGKPRDPSAGQRAKVYLPGEGSTG